MRQNKLEDRQNQNLEDRQFCPPAGLSPESAALWAAVVPRCGRSVERLTAIAEALRVLDIARQAARERAGLLTAKTLASGTVHVHPLLKVEQDARRHFLTLWCGLGLDTANLDSPYNTQGNDAPGVGWPEGGIDD